jgi:hypothetical protein
MPQNGFGDCGFYADEHRFIVISGECRREIEPLLWNGLSNS